MTAEPVCTKAAPNLQAVCTNKPTNNSHRALVVEAQVGDMTDIEGKWIEMFGVRFCVQVAFGGSFARALPGVPHWRYRDFYRNASYCGKERDSPTASCTLRRRATPT